jgi:hypothetical protein
LSFGQTSQLNSQLVHHAGAPSYLCEICKKSCVRKTNLKIHIFVHIKDKPHLVAFCKKSIADMHRLMQHYHIYFNGKEQLYFNEAKFILPDALS